MMSHMLLKFSTSETKPLPEIYKAQILATVVPQTTPISAPGMWNPNLQSEGQPVLLVFPPAP